MPLRPDQLPRDPAELTRMVIALDTENEKLRVALEVFQAMIFGAKSEKGAVISAEQGRLDLGDLATDTTLVANDNGASDATRRTRQRKPAKRNVGALPKHLPRVEKVIEPGVTQCPYCASGLHRIGQDICEVLDVIRRSCGSCARSTWLG